LNATMLLVSASISGMLIDARAAQTFLPLHTFA